MVVVDCSAVSEQLVESMPVVVPLTAGHDGLDARATPAHLPSDLQIRRLREYQAAFGMVDEVFELVAAGGHVGGHDDGADLRRREPKQQELDTVAEMQVDLVARADT